MTVSDFRLLLSYVFIRTGGIVILLEGVYGLYGEGHRFCSRLFQVQHPLPPTY
jgi:hypothetical protein